MDIKFIGSGKDSRSLTFYITDYQTKSTVNTHNILSLIVSACKKLELGHSQPDCQDACAKSRQMMLKCVNRITTETEMSGAHVCSLLLGYNDNYTSHFYRPFDLHCMLRWLDKGSNEEDGVFEDEDLLIEEGNSGHCLVNIRLDYLHRGEGLKHKCLYDYTMYVDSEIDKITLTSENKRISALSSEREVKRGRPENARYHFTSKHPQCKTHIQRARSVPIVPKLSWFPPSEASNIEQFARAMLLLFKPFQSRDDLCNTLTWEEEYRKYQFQPKHQSYIDNIIDMHLVMTKELHATKKMMNPMRIA